MYTTTVHDIEGMLTVTVPVDIAKKMGLRDGSHLEVEVVESRLILTRRRRSKYTTEELLAQCDFSLPVSEEDKQWDAMPAVGRELI